MMRFRWIWGIFLILGVAAPGLGKSPTEESLVQLRDVTVAPGEDGLAVQLRMTGQAKYRHSLIDTPWRVVIDFEGTKYAWRKTPLTVSKDPVRQVRGSQYRKGVARVVLELSHKAGYRVDEGPEGLTVKFDASLGAKAKPKPAPKLAKAEAPKPAAKPEPAKAMPEPKPEKKALAEPVQPLLTQAPLPTVPAPAPIRVAQAPSREPQAPSPANATRLISFDFKDADVVNVFRILAAESGKNLILSDDVKGKISLALKNITWDVAMDIILEARGLEKIERDNVIRIVTRAQLTKEQEEKARAQEAKLKAEVEVRAKVAETQLKEQQVQQRKLAAEAARAETEARGPLTEELIRLAYRDPVEVANTLIGLLGGLPQAAAPAAAPVVPPAGPPFSALYGAGAQPPEAQGPAAAPELLAKGITIKADKPTNSIFIRHYKADLERIKKLIREKLDIPLPQVKITARINEMSRTDLFEIGIRWGGAGAVQDRRNILVGQGSATQNPGDGVTPISQTGKLFGNELRNPNVTLEGFLPVSPTTGLPLGANLVNLPAPGSFGAVAFGIIGTRINLNLILEALESQTKTRSLSKPEIVTMENSKATISLGSEIPYATVSSAGTQIQFKEATLKLEVTPTVIQEPGVAKIKMKVTVTDDSRGADVPSGVAGGFVPSINKRRAETEVIVREGETLVIGGITQRADSETIRKVPLLGDIPVLGWLFKARRTTTDPNREVVVFITPTVLPADQPKPAQSQTEKPPKPKGS